MINTSFYRGFEIIIDVTSGGRFVQRYSPEGKVETLCSQPTEEDARNWIDQYWSQHPGKTGHLPTGSFGGT